MKQKTRALVPKHHLRNRPTKNAKGMTATAHRSGHVLHGHKLTLLVRGQASYAPLSWRTTRENVRGTCPCCGQEYPKKVRLNERGRQVLKRKRNARAKRAVGA